MLASELTGQDLEIYNTNKAKVENLLKNGFSLNWDGFETNESDSPFLLTDSQKQSHETNKREIFHLLNEMPETSFKRRWLKDLFTDEEENA